MAAENEELDTAQIGKHLSDCHINFKKYKKLSKILGNIKNSTGNAAQMIDKFTKKCYGSEPNRNKARDQAKHFLETLFGSCDDLFRLGPNDALEKHVKHQIAQQRRLNKPVVQAELLPNAATSDVKEWDGKISRTLSARGTLWTRKMKHYLIGPTLGVGGTAKVKLGLDTRQNDLEVAVKILKPRYAKDAIKEIETLRKLKHKNVIMLFDEFANVKFGSKEPTSVFVLEYANKGELIEYLMYTGKFEIKLARWMFHDLVEAVDYIHGKGFCHRDLKHDNCLLGAHFMLKVTDFGFAASIEKETNPTGTMNTAIGTEQYAAPEILRHEKYNKAVDVFAMGVMLFIALAGCQPFMRADQRDRWYSNILNGDWKAFWKYHLARAHRFKDESMDLLKKMLEPSPSKRITIKQIREHSFWGKERYAQNEAADILQKRKNKVDKEKWSSGDKEACSEAVNRDLPKDLPCAPCFWSKDGPNTPYYFYSAHKATNIQQALINYIEKTTEQNGLGGVTIERRIPNMDEDEYSKPTNAAMNAAQENVLLKEYLNESRQRDGQEDRQEERPLKEEDGEGKKSENDDDYDFNSLILSNNEDDWSDEETLDNGKYNPYNVKFKVQTTNPNVDVFGIWRIFREYKPKMEEKYVKEKIATIAREDAACKAAIEELDNEFAEMKDSMEAADGISYEERKEAILYKRDENLSEKYLDECLYLSENDREILKIRNIVVFSPWRTPRQEKNKAPKTIKAFDEKKLLVVKKDMNRSVFAEVYKLILSEVATGLMVPNKDDGSDEEKES